MTSLIKIEMPPSNTMCTICRETEADSHGRQWSIHSNSNHSFHTDCILEWLKVAANCPICRREIDYSSAELSQKDIRRTPIVIRGYLYNAGTCSIALHAVKSFACNTAIGLSWGPTAAVGALFLYSALYDLPSNTTIDTIMSLSWKVGLAGGVLFDISQIARNYINYYRRNIVPPPGYCSGSNA